MTLVFQYVVIINTHLAYSALILAVSQQLLSVLSSVNEHQQFCHLPFNCQHPLSMRPYQQHYSLLGSCDGSTLNLMLSGSSQFHPICYFSLSAT